MLIIPLPELRHAARAPVSRAIVVLCVMVWLGAAGLDANAQRLLSAILGVVPRWFMGIAAMPDCIAGPPLWLTPLTASFLHFSFLHLFFNGLWLWVFGPRVEILLGPFRFTVLVVLAAYGGLAFQAAAVPSGSIFGASGIVAGVLGAYAALLPKDNVYVGLGRGMVAWPMPGLLVAGFWIVMQLFSAIEDVRRGGAAGIAYGAHLSGFLFGVGLAATLRPRGVTLFDLKQRWQYRNPLASPEADEAPGWPWSWSAWRSIVAWSIGALVLLVLVELLASRSFRRLIAASVC